MLACEAFFSVGSALKRHNFVVPISLPGMAARFSVACHGRGTYRDLAVWQGAMDLSVAVYRATRKFPSCEIYGLTSQMRRAPVSIASNIAEGKGRFSDKELLQFLGHARGSAYEVQTQIELARMLGYLTKAHEQELVEKSQSIGRMLNKLIASIRESTSRSAA